VKLGTWTLSAGATNQSVSVAGNSAGTVVADQVKAVRDSWRRHAQQDASGLRGWLLRAARPSGRAGYVHAV
jgi:uncharacterized lipoprotein YmbA